jgi:N-acetylneuraminic acid mutarotase
VRTLPWRLPTPLGREAVVAVGGKLVVAGGLVAGDQSTATAYRLDPTNGHVQPLRGLPVPVHDTAGVLLGGRPVVLGGGNTSEQDVVQVQRPGGWTVGGHLPQARSDLAAFTVAGRALVIGGYDAVTPAVPSVLASRDGASWMVIGSLPVPVRYAAGVAQGGAVWLFGGERSGAQQTAVQRIDATTGKAQVVTHLPHPLGHASAIAFGRRILLLGGRTGSTSMTSQMWWFDPATHRFIRAGKLPAPLADTAVAVVGGAAYLVGGESPLVTDRVRAVTFR